MGRESYHVYTQERKKRVFIEGLRVWLHGGTHRPGGRQSRICGAGGYGRRAQVKRNVQLVLHAPAPRGTRADMHIQGALRKEWCA